MSSKRTSHRDFSSREEPQRRQYEQHSYGGSRRPTGQYARDSNTTQDRRRDDYDRHARGPSEKTSEVVSKADELVVEPVEESTEFITKDALPDGAIDYDKLEFAGFDDMPVLADPARFPILRAIYENGFTEPSPIQQKAIEAIASGRDVVAQARSGTGKTLAFLIGALLKIDKNVLRPQVVIVANTRDLASQISCVANELGASLGIKSCLCAGGSSSQDNLTEAMKSHIWAGTPGRIVDLLNRNKNPSDYVRKGRNGERPRHVPPTRECDLAFAHLKMLVLDEADVLLSGDFVNQIIDIMGFIESTTQICVFSATYPESAKELLPEFMSDNKIPILVRREEVNVTAIKHFRVDVGEEENKYDDLIAMYQEIRICQAVIFVNSIGKAVELGRRLQEDGYPVGIIHAQLDDTARVKVLRLFRNMETRVLVATDIIARGIDVQQVGLVINYDIPENAEVYIHRVGRSGRFKKTGVAINFTTRFMPDIDKIRNIERTYPTVKIQRLPNLADVNHYLTGPDGYSFCEKDVAVEEKTDA
jgi:superfamily II DNA/RNA helicase